MALIHWFAKRSRLGRLVRPRSSRRPGRPDLNAEGTAGFTLQETVVVVAVTAIVVASAGFVLQSSLRTIQGSSGLILGRDSNATSLALVRTDVIRGTQLLFRQGNSTADDNLDAIYYQAAMSTCQSLAGSGIFNPVFGIRHEISYRFGPATQVIVIYGLGIGRNGTSYSLQRCGPPIGGTGGSVLSTVIESIAPVPCADGRTTCPAPARDAKGNATDLPALLLTLSHTLGADNTSPLRLPREPAFRFRTDGPRGLIELIDPTAAGDGVGWSFTSSDPTGVSMRAPLYLTARMQAAKVSSRDVLMSGYVCTNCNLFGLPIIGNRLYFVLDGSYTMSACTAWAGVNDVNPDGKLLTYWDPTNTSGNPSNAWISTSRVCLTTRMQTLQQQMRRVLQGLPGTTQVLLMAYTDSSGTNNRNWPANNVLATLGTGSNRNDAIAFIESLDDGNPRLWGANSRAWTQLLAAYRDTQADAVYLLTDGLPDLDYYGRIWSDLRQQDSITPYTNINRTRTKKLVFNSIALGFHASWMWEFSNQSYGTYLRM